MIWFFSRKKLCAGTWVTHDLGPEDLHRCVYPPAHTDPCQCECGEVDRC